MKNVKCKYFHNDRFVVSTLFSYQRIDLMEILPPVLWVTPGCF